MRIVGIEAENFKLFADKFDHIQDVENDDLVILNGPNGYGKTSVFDIIEFCLTGEIKRIIYYNQDLEIAKRSAFDNKILIANQEKDAYVRLTLCDSGKCITIEYDYFAENAGSGIDNNPNNIFGCFERKIKIDGQEVNDQIQWMEKYGLSNFGEVYDKCCFLSQDEHLRFFKTGIKSKAKSLDFLFEIPQKWQDEQERIDKITKKLGDRRNKQALCVKLEEQETECTKAIGKLEIELERCTQGNQVSYERLFPNVMVSWDQKLVDNDQHSLDICEKDLDNLIFFAEHKEQCRNYINSRPYKSYIREYNGRENITFSEAPLEYTLRNYELVQNEKEIEKQYQTEVQEKKLLACIEDHRYEEADWTFAQAQGLITNVDMTYIREHLDIIKKLKQTRDLMQNAVQNLLDSRLALLRNSKIVIQQGGLKENECPLCGHPFDSLTQLNQGIQSKTDALDALIGETAERIDDLKKNMYENVVRNVEMYLKKQLDSVISDEMYQRLKSVKTNKLEMMKVVDDLRKIGIDLDQTMEEDDEQRYENILECVQQSIAYLSDEDEEQLVLRGFEQAYKQFYMGEIQRFEEMQKQSLVNKRNYIRWITYNHYREALEKTKQKLHLINERKQKLHYVLDEFRRYKKSIEEGEKEYKHIIINDIEPLLYVYTAQILQQKFNGKSVFIKTDASMDKINFVNSVTDDQDILYSMSSGQLSAVAVAFLLCMNQVYGTHQISSLLLIDDPVQTIDDVNMVGLVDVLRYGFGDRQIFLSTHEQTFDWYIRYKYLKSDKIVEVVNMRELMLQVKKSND
mgnify:FL=1